MVFVAAQNGQGTCIPKTSVFGTVRLLKSKRAQLSRRYHIARLRSRQEYPAQGGAAMNTGIATCGKIPAFVSP